MLIYAASEGHVEFARMLLERRVVIDAQGNFGMTLIHWAMQLRRIQITRLLLEYGADVSKLYATKWVGTPPSMRGTKRWHNYCLSMVPTCRVVSACRLCVLGSPPGKQTRTGLRSLSTKLTTDIFFCATIACVHYWK